MTNSTSEETVPCETCGVPTSMLATKRCDLCWEVERNLENYLKRLGARIYVRKLLEKMVEFDAADDAEVHRRCEEGIEKCAPVCAFFNSKNKGPIDVLAEIEKQVREEG